MDLSPDDGLRVFSTFLAVDFTDTPGGRLFSFRLDGTPVAASGVFTALLGDASCFECFLVARLLAFVGALLFVSSVGSLGARVFADISGGDDGISLASCFLPRLDNVFSTGSVDGRNLTGDGGNFDD
jgi:hypothetical protein